MTLTECRRAIREVKMVMVLVNISGTQMRGLEITKQDAAHLLRNLTPNDEVRARLDAAGTLFIGGGGLDR